MGLQLSGSVQLEGNLLVTGSANSVFENVLVTGTLVAQEIETQLVSSSIIYSSGSNKFGDLITDTQQFTGSLQVSGSSHTIIGTQRNIGSQTISGSVNISGSITQVGVRPNNIIISDAPKPNLTGTGNTVVGSSAANNITGGDNTFLGYASGFQTTVGFWNTFVGSVAGANNVSGSYNTFVGVRAGFNNVNADNNTFVGTDAGLLNTTGFRNTFLGAYSGDSNTTGTRNTFIGAYAGQFNVDGLNNTFIGDSSGFLWKGGNQNTFLGNNSGGGNNQAIGSFNTGLGAEAGYNLISGSFNTFVGYRAGLQTTDGERNVAVGMDAGGINISGSNNVFIGETSGYFLQSGASNLFPSASIYIGTGTRSNVANQTNQIVIGHNAIGNGSNTVTIGNDNIVSTHLKGNVGIGSGSISADVIDAGLGMAIVSSTGRTGLSLGSNQTSENEVLGRLSFTNTNSTNIGNKRLAYVSGVRGATNNSAYLEFGTANDGLGTQKMVLDVSGSLFLNTTRVSGNNANILTLADNVTGLQTSEFGVRILATSNNGQAKSAIGFEADGGTNNDTRISFYTQLNASSLDRQVTITRNGNLNLVTGNLVIGTAGKGIDFSADGNAGGMTSELLDDYEEGTFTPTAFGETTAGTTTYTNQLGYYTKIGRQVNVTLLITWTALTGTGNLRIGGLPFTSANLTQLVPIGTVLSNFLNWSGGSYLIAEMPQNGTQLILIGMNDDAGVSIQQCVNEAADLRITITYMT